MCISFKWLVLFYFCVGSLFICFKNNKTMIIFILNI
nr:MAG TPA: hypothetical protein [Caudoviricetes sp.]